MRLRARIGVGALGQLDGALRELATQRVLLVTGRRSYMASGAEGLLRSSVANLRVARFVQEATGPSVDEIEKGIALQHCCRAEVVIGVGGSTAIDVAKMIALCATQRAPARSILKGGAAIDAPALPVVAIPTTAGGGSEATRFAVVYDGGVKHSVEDDSLLPVLALVDSRLTYSVPPLVTASTAFDALTQSLESIWSVRSTQRSRALAGEAAALVVPTLKEVVHSPSPQSRDRLARAAHLAGRAIDVTRTTAPHALSYRLTADYGVPHGAAVAMTFGEVLVWNSDVGDDDVSDPRGVQHVREAVHDVISILGAVDPQDARRKWRELMRQVGLATRLSEVGVRTQSEREALARSVNRARLANNPRVISEAVLEDLLDRIA